MRKIIIILLFNVFYINGFGQIKPQLGISSTYGLFSGGSLTLNDSVIVIGDVGFNSISDSLINAFNICDSSCSNFQSILSDLDSVKIQCSAQSGQQFNSDQLNDTTIFPGVYSISGNLNFYSELILKADADSVFIFNISDSIICYGGFTLILDGVSPGNVFFNIGKSLIAYENSSLSGVYLVTETALLFHSTGGRHAIICDGDIVISSASAFYSPEALMVRNFNWLYFGQQCGLKYTQISKPLNQRSLSPPNCTDPGNIQPVDLNLNMPVNATPVKAYIWFVLVASANQTFPASIQLDITDPGLNLSQVPAFLVKQDLNKGICWNHPTSAYSFVKTASYRAEVTSLITGPGIYEIDQVPVTTYEIDPNGITLFVAYIDNNSLQEQGTLMLYDGLFVNQANISQHYIETIGDAGFAPGTGLIPNFSNTFFVIADIQATVDPVNGSFILNNQSVGITASCASPPQMWHFAVSTPSFFASTQNSINLLHRKPGDDCYALVVIGAYHVTQNSNCGNPSCLGPDQYICSGDNVTLTACNGTDWLWSTGATTQSIQVAPTSTTTYTVTVSSGQITDNVTVNVNPLPTAPVISGNTDGCTATGTSFCVIGPQPNITYSYSSNIGGVSSSGFGSCFTPSAGQNLNLGGTITFIATNAFGCKSSTTIHITSCCEGLVYLNSTVLDAVNNTNLWHLFYPYNANQPQTQSGYYIFDPVASGSGNQIHPPGLFTIDHDIEFRNTDLILFFNSEIVVQSGRTLVLSHSSKVKNCTWMWDRIRLEPGARLILSDNSEIIGGINAVFAESGSEFIIRDSYFQNNFIGIHCENGDFSTSSIVNTHFSCSLNGGNLFVPHAVEKSWSSIELNGVMSIDIGDPTSLALTNTFDNSRFGIHAIRSSFHVKNNRFSNITNTQGILSGHGIFADGQGGNFNLTVGGTGAFDYNIFELSTSGIFTRNGYTVDVRNNYFNNINPGSISCRILNSNQIDVDITNNFFNGFGTGILIQNVEGGNVTLSQNYFNNPGSTEGSYAIKLFNAIVPTHPNNTIVSGNLARNLKRSGFWLTNYPYAQINGVNTIEFEVAAPSSGNNNNQVKWGMKIQNSAKVQVLENYVLRPSLTPNGNNPTSAFDNKRYGISVETSYLNTISSNNIIKLGTGIRYFNATTNILTCNDLFHNRIGVSLEGSSIGDQGDNTNSQDNKWNDFASTLWDIRSLPPLPPATPIWYSQSANYPWTPNANFINPSATVNFSYAPSTTSCTNPCPNCRQEEMYRIVTEDGDYALLTEDEIYVLKKEVFLEIQQDSVWVNMNTSFDQPLQAFYDSTLQTSMGQLNLVQNLIPSDTTVAKTLVSIVQPRNHFEENERIVYEIYLATWSRGIEEFTAAQYDALLTIAFENPISGGSAVYTARVMLDLDIDDFVPENGRLAQQGVNSSSTKPIGKVYPNPTTGILNYRLILTDYSDVFVALEDIYGRTINKFKYSDKNGILRISISDYQQGIYTLKAYKRNELINSQKIVKVN